MRRLVNLNFGWYFSPTFSEVYLKDFQNITDFKLINIPHNAVDVPYNYFDEQKTMTICTYKRIIPIKKEYENKDCTLIFEGIAHKATIYCNDDFVLIHKGGYDRFEVNINDFVKYGEDNYITIICDSTENSSIPPFGSFIDYLGYSGIYRETFLEISGKEKIVDYFIRTPNVNNSITAFCDIEVNVTPVEIVISIQDDDKEISVNKYNCNREKETFDFDVKEKINWDIKNPKLYKINIKMYSEKKLLDEINGRFGFREIKANKEGLFLNGKQLKLLGLNRHQSYPYVGYAMPKSAQEKDAEILKYELGCNVVRTSHYMQSKHFLNHCDEIGLLVIEEIPGWQYIGNEEFKLKTLDNVKSMIVRDRNHPSIIMWGVRINESPDNHELYIKTNELAHKLDSSRPTFGVRNFIDSEMLEDVFTFNDFIHEGQKITNTRPQKLPHVITEHNGHMYPTKKYDDEAHRLEHALRHLRVINGANGSNNIAGVIGWCMNDYNTHKDFGSGDKICYHGVMDMYRIPKCAYYAYASQKDKDIMLHVASTLNRGDYAKSELKDFYIFTNCEYVKMFKNDDYVGTYFPDYGDFPNLKHPPIKVDDFIGQILERKEQMKAKDSESLKRIMMQAINDNYKLTLMNKIKCLFIMRKYRRPVTDVYSLFIKYVIGESNKDFIYRFDGYTNENVVKSVTINDVKDVQYAVVSDKDVLFIGDTYDVTRIVIRATDQDNNVLPYAFTPIHIDVEGGIDLIGPKDISLLGGSIAFWIKTNQTGNIGKVNVSIGEFKKNLEFIIK